MRQRARLAGFALRAVPAFRRLLILVVACVVVATAASYLLTGSVLLAGLTAVISAYLLRGTIVLPEPDAVTAILDTSILSLEMAAAVLQDLRMDADGSCRLNLCGHSRGALITDDGAFDIPQTVDDVWVKLGQGSLADDELMDVLRDWHDTASPLSVRLMFRTAGPGAELGSAVLCGPGDVEVRLAAARNRN